MHTKAFSTMSQARLETFRWLTQARARCRRRREHGEWHAAAQRNLLNRMLGQLYHCLQKRELLKSSSRHTRTKRALYLPALTPCTETSRCVIRCQSPVLRK
jgi:hypothetical protein